MTDPLPPPLPWWCGLLSSGPQHPTGKSSLSLSLSLSLTFSLSVLHFIHFSASTYTYNRHISPGSGGFSFLYIFSLLVSTTPKCISYLPLHNKGPQNLAAENNKHLLSYNQESRSGLAGVSGSRSLRRPQSRYQPGLQSSQGMTRRERTSRWTHVLLHGPASQHGSQLSQERVVQGNTSKTEAIFFIT